MLVLLPELRRRNCKATASEKKRYKSNQHKPGSSKEITYLNRANTRLSLSHIAKTRAIMMILAKANMISGYSWDRTLADSQSGDARPEEVADSPCTARVGPYEHISPYHLPPKKQPMQ